MFTLVSLSTMKCRMRSILARHAAVGRYRRELEASSDRALADMGLCRGDIAAVADGSYHNA